MATTAKAIATLKVVLKRRQLKKIVDGCMHNNRFNTTIFETYMSQKYPDFLGIIALSRYYNEGTYSSLLELVVK